MTCANISANRTGEITRIAKNKIYTLNTAIF